MISVPSPTVTTSMWRAMMPRSRLEHDANIGTCSRLATICPRRDISDLLQVGGRGVEADGAPGPVPAAQRHLARVDLDERAAGQPVPRVHEGAVVQRDDLGVVG